MIMKVWYKPFHIEHGFTVLLKKGVPKYDSPEEGLIKIKEIQYNCTCFIDMT